MPHDALASMLEGPTWQLGLYICVMTGHSRLLTHPFHRKWISAQSEWAPCWLGMLRKVWSLCCQMTLTLGWASSISWELALLLAWEVLGDPQGWQPPARQTAAIYWHCSVLFFSILSLDLQLSGSKISPHFTVDPSTSETCNWHFLVSLGFALL